MSIRLPGSGGSRIRFLDEAPALEDMRLKTWYILTDESAGYLKRLAPVDVAGTATSSEWDSVDRDDYIGDYAAAPSTSPPFNNNASTFRAVSVPPMDDFPSAGRRYRGTAAGISSAIQLMERQGDWCVVGSTIFQYLDGVSASQSSLVPGLRWGATRATHADVLEWLESLDVANGRTAEANRPVYMYWTGSGVRRVRDYVRSERIYYYDSSDAVGGFRIARWGGSWTDADTVEGVTVMNRLGDGTAHDARYVSATEAVDTYFEDGDRRYDSDVTYVFFNSTTGNVERIDAYTGPTVRYDDVRLELDFRAGLVFVDEKPALADMQIRTWYILKDGRAGYLKRLEPVHTARTVSSTPWDSEDPDDYIGDHATAPATDPAGNDNRGTISSAFLNPADDFPSAGYSYKGSFASIGDLDAATPADGDWAIHGTAAVGDIFLRVSGGLTDQGPPGIVWGGRRTDATEWHEWLESIGVESISSDFNDRPVYIIWDGGLVGRLSNYTPRGRLYYYDTTLVPAGTRGGFQTTLYGGEWEDTDTVEGVVVMTEDGNPNGRYASLITAVDDYFLAGERSYDADLTYVYYDEGEGTVERITAYSPAATRFDEHLVAIEFNDIEFVDAQPALADMEFRTWYILTDESTAYLKRVDEVTVARTAESSTWDSVDPDDYLGDFLVAPSTLPAGNANEGNLDVFAISTLVDFPSPGYRYRGQFALSSDLDDAVNNDGDWAILGGTGLVFAQILTQVDGVIRTDTAPPGIVWGGRRATTLDAHDWLDTLDLDPEDTDDIADRPAYVVQIAGSVWWVRNYRRRGRLYYYNPSNSVGGFQTTLYEGTWEDTSSVEGVVVMNRLGDDTPHDARYDSAGEAVDIYFRDGGREFDPGLTYVFFNSVSTDVEVVDSYTAAGIREDDTLVTLRFGSLIEFVDQEPALIDMELQTWYVRTDESAAYLKRINEVFTPRVAVSSAWDSVDPDDYLGAFAAAPSTSPASNNNAPADARFTSAILAAGTEKPSTYVFRGVFASAGAFNVAIVAGDPTDWGLLANGDLTIEVGALSSSVEESIPGMEWGGELLTGAAVITWLEANWQNDGRLYAYRRTVGGTQNVYEVLTYTPASQSEFSTSALPSAGQEGPAGHVFRGVYTNIIDINAAFVFTDALTDWATTPAGLLYREATGNAITNPSSIAGMAWGGALADDAAVRTWLDANWQSDGRLYAFVQEVAGTATVLRVDSYTSGIAQTIYYYDTAQGRYFSAPYGGEWAVTPEWPDITIMYEADDGSANDSAYATLLVAVQTYFELFEDGAGRDFDSAVTYVFYNEATGVLEQVDDYAAAFTTLVDTLVTLGAGGLTLGPPTNEFNAATRAAAETLRDDYATANPTWLPQYDAEATFTIILSWPLVPTNTIYQSRRSSAWADVTGLVRGEKGDLGAQGRFVVYAYINAVSLVDPTVAPIGGTFTRNTGTLTVPSFYDAVPETPASGEKTWRVEAVVNPLIDPNVVVLAWSVPVELPAYAAGALAAASATAAAASATAAAASATAAAGSESTVTTSASAAAASASQAATSASQAAASESAASSSQVGAETARTAAQTAQADAETAETDAETAQTGAEAAQTGAETARDAAQGYAAQAQGQAGLLTSYTGPVRIADPVAYESSPTDVTVPNWRSYDELMFVFQDSGGTVGHLSAPVLVDVLDAIGQTESGQQQNDRLTLSRTDGSDILSVGLGGWSGHPTTGDTIAVWGVRSGVTAGGMGGASAFSQLTGQIADGQVPDTFTRDAELRFFPCATSGSGDALVLTTGRSLTALVDGMAFYFITGLTNAGAVTADVDGIGAKQLRVAVRTPSGTLNFQELGANQITPNMPLLAFYSATLDRLYLQQLPPGDVYQRFTGIVEGSVPLVGVRDELPLSVIPATVARLAGAIFTGSTRGEVPTLPAEFATKAYVDSLVATAVAPPSDDIYFGTSADATPGDAELTIPGVGGAGTIEAYAGSRYHLIARLASESDITRVVYSDDASQTNQIGAFTKFGSTVTPAGPPAATGEFDVWVSNQALTQSANVTITVS